MADEDEKVEETTGVSGDTEEEAGEPEETSEGEEAAEEAAPKEKKKKKVVRRRKTKKERENPLTTAVRLAVESGKVEYGAKSAISASLQKKAKLFIFSSNMPQEVREKVAGSAKASGTPVLEFEGSSMELGSVCGKPFPISVLSVFEAGSSSILELAKKK